MNREVHPSARALTGAVLFAVATIAAAQAAPDPQAVAGSPRARALAATCSACHGTDGAAVQGGGMLGLAGYPKDALIAQMRAFRDGARDATVMHQIAKGYSDRQIELLASYLAVQSALRP